MTIKTNQAITPTAINAAAGGVALATSAAASVDTDTPTNATLILTAGSEGARITSVFVKVRATTVADRIILLRGNDASGTTKRPLRSRGLTAYSWSTTVEPTVAQEPDFGYSESVPLFLGPNESLWAIHTVNQTGTPIVVHAEGGKYESA